MNLKLIATIVIVSGATFLGIQHYQKMKGNG